MNIQVKELISKRNSDIDKLKSYLSAGKTPDEKVVNMTITKIRHSEENLLKLGYSNFFKVHDDGTFDTDDKTDTSSSPVSAQKSESGEYELSTNESDQKHPKKTLEKSIKIKTEKLAVSIKEGNKNNLTSLATKSCRTPNNVVNLMLKDLYDEENNKFIISFPKKESLSNTSYLIEDKYYNAIEKVSKKTGLSKSDIFNVLLESALKEYM
ncbi:hypothetical protein [Clostridium butyricum]|uniref:hypothetical protein n=1 Tax=Clostridium butyricum TaxID=1492 RepID=UPI002AB1224B|nr:hypothetical protein [Clostridium butyricum]